MPEVRTMVTRLLERASQVQPLPRGVTVSWHTNLSSPVSRHYTDCGGDEWLPYDLFRAVFENRSQGCKTIALLWRGGAPWAFVPLRRAGRYWEPLFVGVIPETVPFPCNGRRDGALAALRLNIGVWQDLEPPVGLENRRWLSRFTSYELDLRDDPEPYWRARDLWKTIRQSLRRGAGLELVTNDGDGCEWTINRWRDRFSRVNPGGTVTKWADRAVVARWSLANDWQMRSWHLRDGSRWVGGLTGFVLGERLVFGTIYRDPEYDWFGVGHRLFYEALVWGRREGIPMASLGTTFPYKRRWAPGCGSQWSYVVAPWPVHAWNGAIEHAGKTICRGRERQ